MIEMGPIERAKRLLHDESLNMPQSDMLLYQHYFKLTMDEEARIQQNEQQFNLYYSTKKSMMLAKQQFQSFLEGNALDPTDGNYVDDATLLEAANRLLEQQNIYGAIRLQVGFSYASWHDYLSGNRADKRVRNSRHH